MVAHAGPRDVGGRRSDGIACWLRCALMGAETVAREWQPGDIVRDGNRCTWGQTLYDPEGEGRDLVLIYNHSGVGIEFGRAFENGEGRNARFDELPEPVTLIARDAYPVGAK